MMDRLETSFYQATRFSADAAHELNTPLTILQGELEHALQSAELGSNQQQEYSSLLGEVQRLKTIIRKLLLLSLADSGKLKLSLEPVNISETLEAVCEDIEILAPHLTANKYIDSDVWVMADADLIRQVIQNLTNNAIKYNHEGGSITLRLLSEGPVVTFTISNSGRSIPREDRNMIFDRFYRGDKARSRRIDGFGLGLSLAREIARAHRGNLVLEDTPNGITTFTLALPGTEPKR
jgi:signal transduction histidine kinase